MTRPRLLSTPHRLIILAAVLGSTPALWRSCQPWPALLALLALLADLSRPDETPPALITTGIVVIVSISFIGAGGGYLDNPNIAGTVLAMIAPLAIARGQWLAAAVLVGGLWATGSIGGLLAFTAALAALLADLPRFWRWVGNHKRGAILGVLAALVAIVAIVLIVADSRPWWRWRWRHWDLAVDMMADGGRGPGSFASQQFIRSIGPERSYLRGFIAPHAHNLYLQAGAEYGPGAMLAVVVLVLWLVTDTTGPARAAAVAFAVHSLVDATAVYAVVPLVLALIIPPENISLRVFDR
jgi:hypothetical protein